MNERQLFEGAIEITDPQARQAFLDEACRGNSELRAKVEALLKSHSTAGSFLDIPAAGQMGKPWDDLSTNTHVRGSADDSEDSQDSPTDLSFLRPSSKPGSIGVLGHYEVLGVLGHGANGIVFKAFDEKLHRLVAIKVMNPRMALTSPPRKRFLREARSAAAIKHDNVVQVYSVEEEPLPYLVMEYVDGQTLNQKLDGSGPLETPEVLHIARQIASGLAAAQAMGLIHRDIKPANILLERGAEQRVKISDFGLARAADDASMTRTGVISGTPMYMAPEQATGQSLDHRADLFSLGSVLYQMACGRPPFRAPTTVGVLRRVVEDTPRAMQDILPEIPDWLVAIVSKLHAKKPEDRYQTAKEVADLLARCQSELQLNGKVTCVPIQHDAPASGRTPHAANDPSPTRTSPIEQPTPSNAERNHSLARRASDGKRSFGTRCLITVGLVGIAVLAGLIIKLSHNTTTANLASREASAPGQAESTDSTNPDRRAAEWVLSIGGTVTIKEDVQERQIGVIADLPTRAFDLIAVSLQGNPHVSDAGLANFKNSKKLIQIDLQQTGVTDSGLVYFEDCKDLKYLNLHITKVTDSGLAHFKNCKDLTFLGLAATQVTDGGLANFKNCQNLTQISLSGPLITNVGLANIKDWRSIQLVRLSETMVSNAALSGFQHSAKLTHLYLDGTKLSDEGLAHLKNCKDLTVVDLHNTQLSDVSLGRLADYPKLEYLNINKTMVTEAGVKKLSAALPGCKIEWDGGVMEARTGWHGWPSDAPPPAIAPFDAEQAKQHQEAWAKYLNVPVEYTNSIGMKFRLMPPGEFLMGSSPKEIEAALKEFADDDSREKVKSEGPQHKVILTQPTYVSAHEVTQSEYEQVLGKNPSYFAATGPATQLVERVAGSETARHPVEGVSWNDAAEFCAKLSQKEKLKPFYFRAREMVTQLDGTGYRLPTEAEWEFVCRAGTTTKYWLGDKDEDLVRAGWFGTNSGDRSHAVGELLANPFGLYDIYGNVFEWVQDWQDPTYYGLFQSQPSIDPTGPSSAQRSRVFRGWAPNAGFCRSAMRYWSGPSDVMPVLGFRVSLPVDAVRQALKVDGPRIAKPGVPVGANENPVAARGRSAWDDLDPAQIPEAERVPRQPEGLVAVLGQHRRRVWGTIHSMSVSPDGSQFTLTTEDGLYLFGRDPKQPTRFVPGMSQGGTYSATFLPDGRIAYCSIGRVSIELQIFAKPRDGMPLEKQTATTTEEDERMVVASSDGQWLAAYGYSTGSINFWRLGDAAPQKVAKFVLPVPHGNISSGRFSPDAKWFCFTDNNNLQSAVHLIDLRGDTPREATVLKADADEKSDAPAKGFEHAVFLSDGRLATSDRNGRTWFWKLNNGEPERVGSIHATGEMQAASQSLRLVTIDGSLFRVWNLAAEPPQLLGVVSHSFPADNIQTLAIAPNGETIFTGHLNKAVRLWNVSNAGVSEVDPLIPNPRIHSDYQQVEVIDPLLSVSTEYSRVGNWRPTRGSLQAFPEAPPSVQVLGLSSAQRQLIVMEPGSVGGIALLRCDADRMTPIRRMIGGNVQSAALDEEGRRLAIGRHNGTEFVLEMLGWESADLPARKLAEIKSPEAVQQIAFAESGRTLIGRVGFQVHVWDVKDDQLIPRKPLPTSSQYLQFAVATDGHTLATTGFQGLDLWNLKSDLTKPTTSVTIPGTRGVAFSPDGKRLAASFWENGASAGVQVINLSTGVVERLLTFPGRVYEVDFTDDNRHLITGNGNGTIYVVRLEPSPTKQSAE